MADKVHCIRKTLRLMPQEAKVLSDKAKANGMNEAEYIRLLISQKPNDYPVSDASQYHLYKSILMKNRHKQFISKRILVYQLT